MPLQRRPRDAGRARPGLGFVSEAAWRSLQGRALSLLALALIALAGTACGDDGGGGGTPDAGCNDPILCPPDVTIDADAGDVSDEEPVECTADDPCTDDRYCDDTGSCVLGCRLAPDNCEGACASCSASTRTCEIDPVCANACTTDDECGGNQYCDVPDGEDTGQCRTGCRLDAEECPDPDIGYCCNVGQACDPDSRICRDQPCASDGECPALQFCQIPPDDPLGAECADGCRTNPDNCRTSFGTDATNLCDPESRTCQPIDCGTDDELCPAGYVCDASLCREGCRSDDNCASGQPCDPVTRLCGCETDDDCDELTVCVDTACRARCAVNGDCPGSRPFCNDDSGRCFAGCSNELSEPNNSPTGAGGFGDAEAIFGVLCGVDVDWFQVNGNAGETIRLTVAFDPGTLTVEAVGGDDFDDVFLEPVTASEPDSLVVARIDVPIDGPVAIGFSGRGAASEEGDAVTLGYVAQIERFPTDSCEPDAREDDDSPTEADEAPISEGTLTGLSLCADDDGGDWFAFTLPTDRRAEVSLEHDDAEAGLRLEILDSSLALADDGASDEATGSSLFASAGPFPGGEEADLYIRVTGLEPGVDEVFDYTLQLALAEVAACEPDALEAFEGDDTPGDATLSGAVIGGPAVFEDLSACNGDQDWFSLNGLAGGTIEATVTQASTGRDVEIAVIGGDGSMVLASDTGASLDPRTVTLDPVPATGAYFIRVTDVGGSDAGSDGVSYAVQIAITAPDCTDVYEDNDNVDEATPAIGVDELTFDTDSSGTGRACRDDEDWFSVVLPTDGELTAALTIQTPSAVVLELLLDDGGDTTVLASGVLSDTTTLAVPTTALAGGTYAVRVAPGGFLPLAGLTYRLVLTATLEDQVCVDEGIDPGSDPEDAVVVTSGRSGERICPDDADYWRIGLAGPTRLTVDWTVTDPLPDCGVGGRAELYTAQPFQQLAANPMDACSGSFSADYPTGGEALLRVADIAGAVGDTGFGYDFALSQSPLTVCQPAFNGSPSSSLPLQPNTQHVSQVCADGAAWYLLSLSDATNHTFTLDRQTGEPDDPDLQLALLTFEESPVTVRTAQTDDDTPAAIEVSDDPDDPDDLGLHYLRIQPIGGDVPIEGLQYLLDWTTEALTVCQADLFEPNDTDGEALLIGGDMDEEATICPGDTDWFLAPVETSGIGGEIVDVTFRVRQIGVGAPLRLRVYSVDESGQLDQLLDERDDESPTKTIPLTVEEGDYLVEVTAGTGDPIPDGGIAYHADVILAPPVCTDYLEPNDADGEAVGVPVDETVVYQNALACEGDLDVFSLAVTEPDTDLVVTVDRLAPSTGFDVSVRLDGGGVVASTTGGDSQSQIVLAASDLAAGTYFVDLSADAPPSTGERYTVTIASTAPFDCDAADSFESNDSTGEATDLPLPSASVSSRLCDAGPAGYDYYRVAPALGPVSIDAQLTNPSGADITLTLRNTDDDELASGPSISQSGLDAGTYYLRTESGDPGLRGASYGLAVQTELFGCSVDADEPNDAPGAGLPVPPGFGEQRVLCDSDDDYFRFTAAAGDNINVAVAHDSTPFPVEVELLRASDLGVVTSVENALASKILWAFDAEAGDYIVHLAHNVPGGETPPENGLTYELDVRLVGGSVCSEDAFEPNDDPGSVEALPGTAAGILCPSDQDWYRQAVNSSLGDIDLSLTYDDSDSDSLTVAVFDPSGSVLVDSATGTTSPIGLAVTDLGMGDHRVRVTGANTPLLGIGYELTAVTTERGCVADAFEPNDDFGDAAAPETGGVTLFQVPGTICGASDSDFFVLESDGSVTVSVAPAPACSGGDEGCVEPDPIELDVRFYDAGMAPLPNPFDLDHTPGTFFAEVFTPEDPGDVPPAGQSYAFNWTTGPACADDAFETGGDDLGDPADGGSVGTEASLVLCGADIDVIRYTTPSGGPSDVRVQVLLGSAFVEGELELYIEGDLVTPVAVDPGASSPILSARAAEVPADTDVYVRLRLEPPEGVRVPYDLTVDMTAACGDDGNEPNETPGDATTLTAGVDVSGTLCPGDLDLYVTSLVPAGAFTSTIDTGGAVARVDLFELVDDELLPLAGERVTLGNGSRVTAAVDHTATVVTRLSGADSPTAYTVTFESGVCFVDEVDDSGSNEVIGSSQPLVEGGDYALCPAGDEDWLSFEVSGGTSSVRVGVRVLDPSAEFDLELHDDDGVVDGDALGSADETTTPTSGFVLTPAADLADGTYHVRMRSDRAPPLPFAYDVVVIQGAP